MSYWTSMCFSWPFWNKSSPNQPVSKNWHDKQSYSGNGFTINDWWLCSAHV